MQIKRLRLTGFKSFVDPADLRIEPGLTGVVGPNGCGKSNLLEALRWTMGETSARSLRGAGMDDVIFAGTATRPARDFAEVSVLTEADGIEREVVRRIERGTGSAYRIDGRDVRARDVALLFADAATGAHSPALVSQGRISAVIAARPGERRAMLEEAAGIAGLHVRRRDAEQKLRATEANLERLDELIADTQARAQVLRRQARAAERYRTLSGQIRVAEARMIFARWREAAAAAELARAEAARAELAVTRAAAEHRAADATRRQAAETLAGARADALAERDRSSDAAHRLATVRAERDTVVRRLADLDATRTRLSQDRLREGALAEDARTALARLGDEQEALSYRIADAERRLPGLVRSLAEAERAGRDAEVALAQALAAEAGEAAEARVIAAALSAAATRHDRAERDIARVVAELAALGDAAALEAERHAAVLAREAVADALERARATVSQADGDERAARNRRDAAVADRARAKAELIALEAEADTLTRVTARTGGARLLDQLRPHPGHERAVAAALGDDLEAGTDPSAPRYWAGAAPMTDDPAAPAGTVPLATLVAAPEVLARRLHQVFVAEADDGQPLAAGQRLVTAAGHLRRWDGFVANGAGAAAAERLERLNRLQAIAAARPGLERALDTADTALAEVDQAIDAARRAAEESRRAAAAAEARAREAVRTEDRATAQIERLAGHRSDLAQRHARALAEREEAATDRRNAETARAALPDGSAIRRRVVDCTTDAEVRRASVAQARADRATVERTIAQDRDRRSAAAEESKGWTTRAGAAARRLGDMEQRSVDAAGEHETLAQRPAELDAAVLAAETDHGLRRRLAEAALATEHETEAAVRRAEDAARTAAETLAAARESRAGALARAENQELRRIELGRVAGERFECPAPVLPERLGFDPRQVGEPQAESQSHERLTLDRDRLGPVNLVAERELAQLEADGTGSAAERDELGLAVNRLRGSIGILHREGRQRLLAAFEAVDGHFRRLFTTLFDGGQAHLALIDSDDPLEAGLEIMAQPPGKKLQSLTLLSGGEQALTAVALIFGLFLTNPAPICVLDEVDAPLDDANIERFCDLLDAMTRETATRYLIVTHNAVTMSRMHRLFGVTMIERGVSRLVSVDLQAAETLLATE